MREASDAELAAVDKAQKRLAEAKGTAAKEKATATLAGARDAASAAVVSTIPAAVAWDAQVDPHSGDLGTFPVKLTVTQKGTSAPVPCTELDAVVRGPAKREA